MIDSTSRLTTSFRCRSSRLEAIKAAAQWRFRPGLQAGRPVPVLVTIDVAFAPR